MSRLFYGTGEFEVAQFGRRTALEVIEMVMTAFDCVVPDGAGVYCSSDVTTGRRLYFEVYPRHGARSTEELKDRLGPEDYKRVKGELIKSNIARCGEFAELLRRRGLTNLINPGPFVGLGFDQQHYHYLWELVIVRKAHQSFFNEGWEYSNGCTLEYAISHRKGIPVFDHLGRPLPLAEALRLIERAVADLKTNSISVPMLERNLELIRELD
ncbi:MAG TPA: hypothetical protein VEY09_13635 [Pyrinomonadaceae bacterium]|nr:hypothetical protein [Pyrinomonadaceae bacterium]